MSTTWEQMTPKNHSKILRTIAFSPMFEASVFTVAKRKSDMPIRAEDPTIAYVEVNTSSSCANLG